MSGKVLVSGASGYIASHVINELLIRGYHVVGTVRSLANKDKYAFLYELPHAK
jgi:nucleoside-diphosphate-sugar epimerase